MVQTIDPCCRDGSGQPPAEPAPPGDSPGRNAGQQQWEGHHRPPAGDERGGGWIDYSKNRLVNGWRLLEVVMKYDEGFWSRLDHVPMTVVAPLALVWVALTTAIDYLSGPALSLSIFYLPAILLVCWTGHMWASIGIGVLSSVCWQLVNFEFVDSPFMILNPNEMVPFWNTAVRLGYFVTFALVVSRLRDSLRIERRSTRSDYLTGLANSKAFLEVCGMEMARGRRHASPITIVYMDCDNFKTVNDTFGHSVGDELLREIGATMKKSLRIIDIPARLGGDEFAILLPETSQEQARLVVERLLADLLAAMASESWPVTFSLGVVTFATPPQSSRELISAADDLMYEVKRSTKNSIAYRETA